MSGGSGLGWSEAHRLAGEDPAAAASGEPEEPTTAERIAAITESAAGMNVALQKMAGQLTQLGEAAAEAMRKTVEGWPPERLLAAAVEEYNRRMAEINRRGEP